MPPVIITRAAVVRAEGFGGAQKLGSLHATALLQVGLAVQVFRLDVAHGLRFTRREHNDVGGHIVAVFEVHNVAHLDVFPLLGVELAVLQDFAYLRVDAPVRLVALEVFRGVLHCRGGQHERDWQPGLGVRRPAPPPRTHTHAPEPGRSGGEGSGVKGASQRGGTEMSTGARTVTTGQALSCGIVCKMNMIRKYVLATRLNCRSKFLGKKFHTLYLPVLMRLVGNTSVGWPGWGSLVGIHTMRSRPVRLVSGDSKLNMTWLARLRR